MQDGSLEYPEGTGRDRVSCACRSARGEVNDILPPLFARASLTDAGQGLALKGADEVDGRMKIFATDGNKGTNTLHTQRDALVTMLDGACLASQLPT